MAYDYQSKDGLCESNNKDFVALWNSVDKEYNENKRQWIADLRSQGVKASHPDDGWVDRVKNTVSFSYPQFNDGVVVGDTIALGWSHNEHRLVKVVSIEPMYTGGEPRYAFEPIRKQEKTNWFIRLLFGD